VNGWQIGLIAYFALSALLNVALIGKERKQTTPFGAVVAILILAGMVYVAVRA
jgi:hypothetical protein